MGSVGIEPTTLEYGATNFLNGVRGDVRGIRLDDPPKDNLGNISGGTRWESHLLNDRGYEFPTIKRLHFPTYGPYIGQEGFEPSSSVFFCYIWNSFNLLIDGL